jgi:hypothetical protein
VPGGGKVREQTIEFWDHENKLASCCDNAVNRIELKCEANWSIRVSYWSSMVIGGARTHIPVSLMEEMSHDCSWNLISFRWRSETKLHNSNAEPAELKPSTSTAKHRRNSIQRLQLRFPSHVPYDSQDYPIFTASCWISRASPGSFSAHIIVTPKFGSPVLTLTLYWTVILH